jgi:hypothetical protein
MADKYFNREEAEAMLPLIEHCLNEARESKEKVEDLDRELSRAKTEIMVLGGSFPPYRELATNRSEREEKMTQLQEAIERIQETGCVVKDLDEGLIDFPAMRGGEEVYLCWKLGEERIEFWHGIEEGFAGRKPLESETPEEPEKQPPEDPRIQ